MHASKDIRKLKCFDGLHYAFEILEYNYEQLYDQCLSIIEDDKNIVSALSMCWALIDSLHRIREISQAIPGLNQKHHKLKSFLESTSTAETYRHYIQHLRNRLLRKETNTLPVWGSLSWVDPKDITQNYIAIIGTQIPGTRFTGCIYDNFEKKWVSKVCLGAENSSFNFDPIYESTMAFKEFIMPWIESTYEPGVKITKKVPIIKTKMVTKQA